MKHDVFNQYVERVADLFNINKEDIFSKSKKREFVDAFEEVVFAEGEWVMHKVCSNFCHV